MADRPYPKVLSFIIPLYNEAKVLPELRQRLEAVVKNLPCDARILLVNDGSRDGTSEFIQAWAEENSKVQVIELSRNFGHQAAITAGLDLWEGDAAIVMDGDLQDPPELALQFLEKYREGCDIVFGQRVRRHGIGRVRATIFAVFYRLMRRFVVEEMPVDVGDFRLMSRAAADALGSLREGQRFLRAMVSWLGFRQGIVRYERPGRSAGESKYPYSKLVELAWNGILSFSSAPLRLSSFFGLIALSLGMLMGGYALFVAVTKWQAVPGWASLVIVNCMMGGTILICLGFIGEYVARIYEELKHRPLYIIRKSQNLKYSRIPDRAVIVETTSANSNQIRAVGGRKRH